MQTLEEVKQYLRDNWEKGTECPCCQQYVKLWRRSITASMGAGLITIYKHFRDNPEDEYVHVPTLVKQNHLLTGDFAKLRFWGFIEEKPDVRDDGSKRSGFYRITDDGELFARGMIRAPKYVFIYNNTVYDSDDRDRVNIHEVLEKGKFNYQEIMDYE